MTTHAIQWQAWDLAAESDRRFRRWCFIIGVPLLVIGAVVPFLELVGLTRGGGTLSGQRYVEFLPEQPAPIAEKVEEPAPAEEDQPEPPQEVKAEPRPEPTPKPVEQKPQPEQVAPKPPDAQQLQQQARQVASRSGVMAFADQLADLRDNSLPGIDTSRALSSVVSARSGSGAPGASSGGASDAFAQSATQTSGGIQSAGTGETRRTQSGTGVGQRRTTVVESPVGFGEDRTRPGQGGDKLIAGRTLEEIQLVFDRNKGAFAAIFRRHENEFGPLPPGKIVVRLTIQPDGSVTECTLVSSSYNNPDLEKKVIQRVLLLNFGAKDVGPFTYPDYPINYLPS